MRENLKTKSYEYTAVYMDDLYIASPKPKDIVNTLKSNTKSKSKQMQNYLIIEELKIPQ